MKSFLREIGIEPYTDFLSDFGSRNPEFLDEAREGFLGYPGSCYMDRLRESLVHIAKKSLSGDNVELQVALALITPDYEYSEPWKVRGSAKYLADAMESFILTGDKETALATIKNRLWVYTWSLKTIKETHPRLWRRRT